MAKILQPPVTTPADEPMVLDEALVALFYDRDERAIRETDNKYGKYLYVIAYNIVHDRLDCEECLNDYDYYTIFELESKNSCISPQRKLEFKRLLQDD